MTLKTKITAGFLALLLLLLALGAYAFFTVQRLESSSRDILKANFYSVELGQQMLQALDGLQTQPDAAPALSRFQRDLTREAGNITEPGEQQVVDSLTATFAAYRRQPEAASLNLLRGQTHRMIRLNTAALTGKNERANLVANLRKFPEGGWLSVLLSGVILIVIVAWMRGQAIRADLTEFVPVADWLPLLQTLSNDKTVPKYATHLVYLTKSTDPALIENGIIHSIFKKNPKRADVYYFVHITTEDEPYTRTFHVTHVVPQELVRIDFKLGFRVDQAVNYMFRQVVTDLVRNREIDITSRYESLREQDIVGDFQFVLINKTLPYEHLLRGWQRVLLRLHGGLKWLGASEQENFGLDNSAFVVENVPLHMPARPELHLVRE